MSKVSSASVRPFSGSALLQGARAAWLVVLTALPGVAFAAGNQTLKDLILKAANVVFWSTPFAMLLLLFFWSMFQLIMTTGDAEKQKQAKQRIIWGIIAIFVVFSVGGLIAIVQSTFFGNDSVLSNPPTGQ